MINLLWAKLLWIYITNLYEYSQCLSFEIYVVIVEELNQVWDKTFLLDGTNWQSTIIDFFVLLKECQNTPHQIQRQFHISTVLSVIFQELYHSCQETFWLNQIHFFEVKRLLLEAFLDNEEGLFQVVYQSFWKVTMTVVAIQICDDIQSFLDLRWTNHKLQVKQLVLLKVLIKSFVFHLLHLCLKLFMLGLY